MTYALTKEKGNLILWWHLPPTNVGRWVSDPAKAKQYKSEWGAHIAWTAVSSRHSGIKCVPHPVTNYPQTGGFTDGK